MRLFKFVLAIMLVAGTFACSTSSIKARYAYNTETDFSAIKSFAWRNAHDNPFSTPENNTYFISAMERALSAKGLTKNSQSPDFVISTDHVNSYREKYELYEYGEIEFEKKILRVNFIHPTSGTHIYEGVASAFNDPSWSQEQKNEKIDEAVEAVLGQFPPSE